MARAQVYDSNKRGASTCGPAEAKVVRDDNASLARRTFENLSIWPTDQTLFRSSAQVAPARSKAFNDVWTDVLICQEGKVERLHAVILSSQVCSPLSTSAAY